MERESYFDLIHENAIRIEGRRIGIEHVLANYREGASPKEIPLHAPFADRILIGRMWR